MPSDPAATARAVIDLIGQRSPTLGGSRLVCIDGPSGAGKTELATHIVQLTGARLIHLDDLYEGWQGLDTIPTQLQRLLHPLAEGRPGTYEHYDWTLGARTHVVEVAPHPVIIIEGVGSGSLETSELVTVLVWLDAPPEVRRERALAREPGFAHNWDRWARSEEAHFASHDTAARADLTVLTH